MWVSRLSDVDSHGKFGCAWPQFCASKYIRMLTYAHVVVAVCVYVYTHRRTYPCACMRRNTPVGSSLILRSLCIHAHKIPCGHGGLSRGVRGKLLTDQHPQYEEWCCGILQRQNTKSQVTHLTRLSKFLNETVDLLIKHRLRSLGLWPPAWHLQRSASAQTWSRWLDAARRLQDTLD